MIRVIDGEVFIALHAGKTEIIMLPAEAIGQAESAANEAETQLRQIAAQTDHLMAKLQKAVFLDEPTTDLRARLAALNKQSEQHRAEIGRRRRDAANIRAALDRHHADELQQQHHDHLAALVAPYDRILKECHP